MVVPLRDMGRLVLHYHVVQRAQARFVTVPSKRVLGGHVRPPRCPSASLGQRLGAETSHNSSIQAA
eukprot:1882270-Prymnesium_polylepis.1